jgi:hypothetical protein
MMSFSACEVGRAKNELASSVIEYGLQIDAKPSMWERGWVTATGTILSGVIDVQRRLRAANDLRKVFRKAEDRLLTANHIITTSISTYFPPLLFVNYVQLSLAPTAAPLLQLRAFGISNGT